MDIDVDVGGSDVKIDEILRLHPLRNETVVGREHRFMEIRMAHIAAIDEEILQCSFALGSLGLSHESCDMPHGSIDIKGQEILSEALAKDVGDTLQERTCTEVEQFVAMVGMQ